MHPKNLKRLYVFSTLGVAVAFTFGGLADVLHVQYADQTMTHLGYPEYFTTLIGCWKILGVVAVIVPGFERVKEWAYAGMFFDTTGAALSHAALGDGAAQLLPPVFVCGLVVASWASRPEDRKLRKS